MKITSLSAYQIPLTLQQPYKLSGGRLSFDSLESTIIKIETDENITGWGEACPWGHTYLPAFSGGIKAALPILFESILGLDPRCLGTINRTLDKALPGHLYAKSGIDIACWDILGKSCSLPLYDLLGGKQNNNITLHASISTDTPENMVKNVRQWAKRGYKIFTVKIGGNTELDILRIETLHKHKQSDEQITFDINRAWLPSEAIKVMNSCSHIQSFFEQPCETLQQCKAVRQLTTQPLILDECLHDIQDLNRMINNSIAELANIKIGRVGGLTKAKQMRDLCVSFGIKMNIEETGGTFLADSAAVHLAQSTPTEFHHATWLCGDMLNENLLTNNPYSNNIAGGVVKAPKGPGLGVAPNIDLLGQPFLEWSKNKLTV